MQNRAAPVGKTFRPVKNVVTAPGAAELPERELQGSGAWENEFQTGSDNTGAWTGRCSTCGWFTGASMLFHNIGKIQNYNEIISSYPSPLYINPPAVFVIVTVAEALLAVLIVMVSGCGCRPSSCRWASS